ncbi:MAG: LysM peptidoglycan-binding domain-containing protein [Fusicatenibacter sp.]|nr:LysM peptidoglycan-binding domain-containing protein [Fusicatenibacter sp.]
MKKTTTSLRTKRKIQKRNNRIKAVAALLSILIVVLLIVIHFTPQETQADSAPKAPTYKYYTSIRVEHGDTLWDIAKEYRTEEYNSIQSYIEEVKTMNHLTSDKITDGMYLSIPYYSTEYKA